MNFSKFEVDHAMQITFLFDTGIINLTNSYWLNELSNRQMNVSDSEREMSLEERSKSVVSTFVWPSYTDQDDEESKDEEVETTEKVKRGNLSKNDAMPFIFEWLIYNINKIWCKFDANHIENLGFKFKRICSDNSEFELFLPNGSRGSTDIMILASDGCLKQNLVNIEIKSCEDRPKENLAQSIAQLFSANCLSLYPVLQFTTDMQQIFEIRTLNLYEGHFTVGTWSVSMNLALHIIVFWLKFVKEEFKFENGVVTPPKSSFFKSIYTVHRHIKRKGKKIKTHLDSLFETQSKIKNSENEQRKKGKYSNFER